MSVILKSILIDAIERTQESFGRVLNGLSLAHAHWQPTPASNSIVWLAWHSAREIDLQIADLAGTPKV